jgi:hypothetical protein
LAFQLSDRAKLLAAKTQKNIQLVVEIDGYDKKFGTLPMEGFWKIGDPYFIGDTGLLVGGTIEDLSLMPLVTMDGTTNQITQQLNQDKGGTSSVQSMTVSIIDLRGEIGTELNALVPDVLSRRCNVYLGFGQSIFPEDFATIFIGQITEFLAGSGTIRLKVVNPERLKQQEVFIQGKGEITSVITSGATTIPVDTTTEAIVGAGELTSYLRIDDEVIKYESKDSTNFLTCARGQLGTLVAEHDGGASYETLYVLEGNPIDLALKVMLSGETYYIENEIIKQSAIDKIYIDNANLASYYNIQLGDLLYTTGLDTDLVGAVVNGIETTDLQTIIQYEITTPAVDEFPVAGFLSIKSQYSTLPDGCKIKPWEVDVDQFESIKLRSGSSLPTAVLYIKQTVKASELINTDLLYPIGGFSLPRKGRVSMGYVSTPTAESTTKTLNKDNIIFASKISISRSTEKNFYNAIVYRYDESVYEDKFLKGKIYYSAESQNRIRAGNKPMIIDARIFRSGAENYMEAQAQKFLDRYQFGSETFSVAVTYAVGWDVEVGDSIIVDGADLKMFDSKTNSRTFAPRIMEVFNKSLSLKDGSVTLDLGDTSYSLTGRFVSIAPSSKIKAGSTTTNIILQNSPSLQVGEDQTDRFAPFVRGKIKICSPDYATQYQTVIRSVVKDPLDPVLVVDAVAVAPDAGWAVLVDDYDTDVRNPFKPLFGFLNPIVSVTSSASTTEFGVAAGDVSKFFVGAYAKISTLDYTTESEEVIVTDIDGTNITVSPALEFIPDSSHIVSLIGFNDDDGLPYRYS